MTPNPHDPAAGTGEAPYTNQSLAQLALASAAQELAERATSRVAIYHRPDNAVEDAAAMVRQAQRVLERAVIAQREAGISWEEIGAQLDITKQSAHSRFAAVVEEWEKALSRPLVIEEMWGIGGLQTYVGSRMPDGTARPEETAAYLDRWALAHAAADGREPPGSDSERPVSGGMVRMDPLAELMGSLIHRSAALRDEFMGPPPHLMAEIAERRAALWEQVATEGGVGGRPVRDARKYAAEERESAADYRAQDAHLRSIAAVQSPEEHAAAHEQRWPHAIYGPYRVFPDVASARDWCAHCNVWIG
ncbi:hypothetical protein [Nonomuraea sp. NPDC050310]|uniref:hypothetical protein n=1 Tax=Nonomuraea sp. NPDC050310 TaxID=3154935 RepID=UPI0033FDB0B9